MTSTSNVIVGNVYDKYYTKNPIARHLMNNFLGAVTEFYDRMDADSVLEVGCGEGNLAHHLRTRGKAQPKLFVASDLKLDKKADGLDPRIDFREASVYELPFPNKSFGLVVCCEVLEHLERPEDGLSELARVARNGVLLSTPREPLWRAMNMARARYLKDLGNTPGHIQHFSRAGLVKLVQSKLDVLDIRTPIPWTIVLGAPKV